jgi:hypothetical protein
MGEDRSDIALAPLNTCRVMGVDVDRATNELFPTPLVGLIYRNNGLYFAELIKKKNKRF